MLHFVRQQYTAVGQKIQILHCCYKSIGGDFVPYKSISFKKNHYRILFFLAIFFDIFTPCSSTHVAHRVRSTPPPSPPHLLKRSQATFSKDQKPIQHSSSLSYGVLLSLFIDNLSTALTYLSFGQTTTAANCKMGKIFLKDTNQKYMRTFKSLMLSGDACRENCLFMLKTPILNTWELQCMRAEMNGYMVMMER